MFAVRSDERERTFYQFSRAVRDLLSFSKGLRSRTGRNPVYQRRATEILPRRNPPQTHEPDRSMLSGWWGLHLLDWREKLPRVVVHGSGGWRARVRAPTHSWALVAVLS